MLTGKVETEDIHLDTAVIAGGAYAGFAGYIDQGCWLASALVRHKRAETVPLPTDSEPAASTWKVYVLAIGSLVDFLSTRSRGAELNFRADDWLMPVAVPPNNSW